MFLNNNYLVLNSNKTKYLLNLCKSYSMFSKCKQNDIKSDINLKTIILRPNPRKDSLIGRHIFGFPFRPTKVSKVQRYSERRLLGYSKDQLYEVVSRVEDYRLFVPACVKSKVLQRTPTHLSAELEIGIPPLIWEKYTSRVTLNRPHSVSAKCIDGKIFNHLDTDWKFGDGLADNPKTCTLDFRLAFEFKSLVHSQLVQVFFDEMARQTVNAFLKRVEQLYGKQCLDIKGNPLTHKT